MNRNEWSDWPLSGQSGEQIGYPRNRRGVRLAWLATIATMALIVAPGLVALIEGRL